MYIKPSFSKGGIEELLLDEMNDLRTDHHCLEVRLPDFNLSAKRSFIACLDSRIAEIPLLRISLNLRQSEGLSVLLAFLYALLRFRISSFMRDVIQGGSPARIVTTLLGIQNIISFHTRFNVLVHIINYSKNFIYRVNKKFSPETSSPN